MPASYKSKHKAGRFSRRCKIIAALLCVAVVITAAYIFVSIRVNPVIISFSKAQISKDANKEVNESVTGVIARSSNKLTDLLVVSRDGNGKINMVSADSLKLAALSRDLASEAQKSLKKLEASGVSIPAGTLSGFPVFMGKGTAVKFNLTGLSGVSSTVKTAFYEAGINQTKFSMYLIVECSVSVLLPLGVQEINVAVETPVCETIILGEVPELYLNGGLPKTGSIINLVP